jgi:hypothetical protein
MKIMQAAVEEVVGAAALLCLRGESKEATVHLPSGVFPPPEIKKAFKWTSYESPTYGNVRMLAFPHRKDGHWVILVKFEQRLVMNPVLPRKVGKKLLEKPPKPENSKQPSSPPFFLSKTSIPSLK